MDRLRAIQYFHCSAECGSFAAAARSMSVSKPAVTMLVARLERDLGVMLLHRGRQGLSLTAEGKRYYDVSRRLLAELKDLELNTSSRKRTLRGTLTVGINPFVGRHLIAPYLTRILDRYPEVELVLHHAWKMQDVTNENLDIAVLLEWPEERDVAVRVLAKLRMMVCASPSYWARHGEPGDPEQLRQHQCLIYRPRGRPYLDRWTFERQGERRVVDVNGPVRSDDRDWLVDIARSGGGVICLGDLLLHRHIEAGELAPSLIDWEAMEGPPIFAAYRPSQRQSKLLRGFLDFLAEVFAEIEAARRTPARMSPAPEPNPDWLRSQSARASMYAPKRRAAP